MVYKHSEFICKHQQICCPQCAAETADLRAALAELVAAVEHYADEKNWIDDGQAGYCQYFCGRDDAKLVFVTGEDNGYDIADKALAAARKLTD